MLQNWPIYYLLLCSRNEQHQDELPLPIKHPGENHESHRRRLGYRATSRKATSARDRILDASGRLSCPRRSTHSRLGGHAWSVCLQTDLLDRWLVERQPVPAARTPAIIVDALERSTLRETEQ
jgi:hypothetical protein